MRISSRSKTRHLSGENTILIVDDDESICRSLKLIFNRQGYKVDIAVTGQEAIGKLQDKSFNLVLLELKLPDTEGIGLIKHFTKVNPDMGIIIITGYASLETAVRAVNEGVVAYITKPLDIKEVLAKIKKILKKQRIVIRNKKLLEVARA